MITAESENPCNKTDYWCKTTKSVVILEKRLSVFMLKALWILNHHCFKLIHLTRQHKANLKSNHERKLCHYDKRKLTFYMLLKAFLHCFEYLSFQVLWASSPQKRKIHSSFTHPNVITNLYDIPYSFVVEDILRNVKKKKKFFF